MGVVYLTNVFKIFSHVKNRQVRQSLLLWVITTSWLSYCAAAKVDCDKNRGFWCSRTDTCIPASAQCDTRNDCTYGEDEVNCSGYCAEVGQFWCNESKRCIFHSSRCDSYRNCEHGEDETDCPNYCRQNGYFWCQELTKCVGSGLDEDDIHCPSYCANIGHFWCNKSIHCISTLSRCNGNKDCAYGEDEDNCDGFCSNANEAWCSSSRLCFNASSRCDGIEQCSGGEDEYDCLSVCHKAANFWCNISNKCVSTSSRCDGTVHCSFGEDETNCMKTEPPSMPRGGTERSVETGNILAVVLPNVIVTAIASTFVIYKCCCSQKYGIRNQISALEGHKANIKVEIGAVLTTVTSNDTKRSSRSDPTLFSAHSLGSARQEAVELTTAFEAPEYFSAFRGHTEPKVAAVFLTPPLFCESVHNVASTTPEKAESPAYASLNYVPAGSD